MCGCGLHGLLGSGVVAARARSTAADGSGASEVDGGGWQRRGQGRRRRMAPTLATVAWATGERRGHRLAMQATTADGSGTGDDSSGEGLAMQATAADGSGSGDGGSGCCGAAQSPRRQRRQHRRRRPHGRWGRSAGTARATAARAAVEWRSHTAGDDDDTGDGGPMVVGGGPPAEAVGLQRGILTVGQGRDDRRIFSDLRPLSEGQMTGLLIKVLQPSRPGWKTIASLQRKVQRGRLGPGGMVLGLESSGRRRMPSITAAAFPPRPLFASRSEAVSIGEVGLGWRRRVVLNWECTLVCDTFIWYTSCWRFAASGGHCCVPFPCRPPMFLCGRPIEPVADSLLVIKYGSNEDELCS